MIEAACPHGGQLPTRVRNMVKITSMDLGGLSPDLAQVIGLYDVLTLHLDEDEASEQMPSSTSSQPRIVNPDVGTAMVMDSEAGGVHTEVHARKSTDETIMIAEGLASRSMRTQRK